MVKNSTAPAPEVVAVISAALSTVLNGKHTILAIRRTSPEWIIAGRIKLMNTRCIK